MDFIDQIFIFLNYLININTVSTSLSFDIAKSGNIRFRHTVLNKTYAKNKVMIMIIFHSQFFNLKSKTQHFQNLMKKLTIIILTLLLFTSIAQAVAPQELSNGYITTLDEINLKVYITNKNGFLIEEKQLNSNEYKTIKSNWPESLLDIQLQTSITFPTNSIYTNLSNALGGRGIYIKNIIAEQNFWNITGNYYMPITLTPPQNTAPTATPDTYTINQGETLNDNVLTNDTDSENNPLTAILVDHVVNGTLTLNSDGSFTYTPNQNFVGTDSFTYKANDENLASKSTKVLDEYSDDNCTDIKISEDIVILSISDEIYLGLIQDIFAGDNL